MSEVLGYSREEFSAIERYLESVPIPIFAKADDNPIALGTGTLFEIAGRHFLITADHIFDDYDVSEITVPLGRRNGIISSLGTCLLCRPNKELKLDIAVVELQDDSIVRTLKERWQLLTLSQVSSATENGDYALVGFPAALTDVTPDAINQTPLAIFTDVLPEAPVEATEFNPAWDLFFALKPDTELTTGEVRPTPRLPGASGAAVWKLTPYHGALWAPEKVAKVIGIQQSALHGKWFRATSWKAATPILQQFGADISGLFSDAAGGR